MALNGNSDMMTNQLENKRQGREKRIAELLDNGEARELMIRRLKEGGQVVNKPPPAAAGGAGTFIFPSASGSITGGSAWPLFPM